MAAFSVHAKARKHDDEHEDHAHGHSGLGKGIMPDIGAWFLVQKKVPADVVPQFVPPGFAPDRQDNQLARIAVAEKAVNVAQHSGYNEHKARDEVRHAGIAHVKGVVG